MKPEDKHPPSTKRVYFYTGDDPIAHRGFFVKNINKHVCGVNRWKDIDTNVWYDDQEVISWKDL